MPEIDILDEAFVVSLPVLIKANTSGSRRLIEFECSNIETDEEGDVIAQSGLLSAAPGFIARGILDRDHLSEVGARYGIPNPSDFIVGTPLEVVDGGGGRTIVRGELQQSRPGIVSEADQIWKGITANPPVKWRASIYGIPLGSDSFIDVRVKKCPEFPAAKRYVVKSLDWRSTALTQNPINQNISGHVTITTMKAHLSYLRSISALPIQTEEQTVKADPVTMPTPAPDIMLLPRNRLELLAHYALHMANGKCGLAGPDAPLGRSIASFRAHFSCCCGCDDGLADIMALAMMQALKHERSL